MHAIVHTVEEEPRVSIPNGISLDKDRKSQSLLIYGCSGLITGNFQERQLLGRYVVCK
jgi:hypothetical protein